MTRNKAGVITLLVIIWSGGNLLFNGDYSIMSDLVIEIFREICDSHCREESCEVSEVSCIKIGRFFFGDKN